MSFTEVVISITGGLVIELFFSLIRYRDEENKYPPAPKYRSYDNYVTVNEFVAGGQKRWLRYIMFRSLPPLIIFILIASIYQKYFPSSEITYLIFLSAIISLFFRDFFQLFSKNIYLSEKLVHIFNIMVVLLAAFFVSYISSMFSINILAPSVEGIIDNLWTSLLVAFLIILYLDATNQKNDDIREKNNYRDNSIITIYNRLREKFSGEVKEKCDSNNCSEALLFAIMIYEEMNRPFLVRILENMIVKTFSVGLTVGIMQIKSNRPLTDEESIEITAKRMKESRDIIRNVFDSTEPNYEKLKKIISHHNKGSSYTDSVIQILYVLKKYTEGRFN